VLRVPESHYRLSLIKIITIKKRRWGNDVRNSTDGSNWQRRSASVGNCKQCYPEDRKETGTVSFGMVGRTVNHTSLGFVQLGDCKEQGNKLLLSCRAVARILHKEKEEELQLI
jgi:hypothetical protein